MNELGLVVYEPCDLSTAFCLAYQTKVSISNNSYFELINNRLIFSQIIC